jgi:hypothetical protein
MIDVGATAVLPSPDSDGLGDGDLLFDMKDWTTMPW